MEYALEPQLGAGEFAAVLLAAPGAEGYYPEVGLASHPSAWIIPSKR